MSLPFPIGELITASNPDSMPQGGTWIDDPNASDVVLGSASDDGVLDVGIGASLIIYFGQFEVTGFARFGMFNSELRFNEEYSEEYYAFPYSKTLYDNERLKISMSYKQIGGLFGYNFIGDRSKGEGLFLTGALGGGVFIRDRVIYGTSELTFPDSISSDTGEGDHDFDFTVASLPTIPFVQAQIKGGART